MDDHQLCLGARNEYGSNLAGVIPSYRTYRPRACASFTHLLPRLEHYWGPCMGTS
jgi:hypothetical protein